MVGPLRIALAVQVAFGVACAGGGRAPHRPSSDDAAGDQERVYPALRMVPAPVTYALVTARVADLSRALRELAAAFALVVGEDVSDLDQWMRRSWGTSPLRANDLASIGFSLERSAVIFSRELYPTLVLPIADGDQLTRFLEGKMPERGMSVRRHRGYEVYAWRRDDVGEDELSGGVFSWVNVLSWAQIGEWLIVHLGGSRIARDLTWLDDVLSAESGPRLSGDPALGAALALARRHLPAANRRASAPHPLLSEEAGAGRADPGIIGVLSQKRVLSALRAASPVELAPCWGALDDDRGRLVVAANASWDGADGVVAVELTKPAATELASALADPPPPGFAGFREESGFYIGGSIGLGWLAALAERTGCELVAPFGDRVPAQLGGDSVTAFHLAGSDFRISLAPNGTGRAALYLGLRDRAFAEQLLDRIPQRSLLTRKKQVHGTEVHVIGVAPWPVAAWVLRDRAFLGAVGSGVIERVLAPSDPPAAVGAGAEIAALEVTPARITDLPGSLSQLGAVLTGWSPDRLRGLAAQWTQRLVRYEYGRLRVAIDGKSLVLTGRMRLR